MNVMACLLHIRITKAESAAFVYYPRLQTRDIFPDAYGKQVALATCEQIGNFHSNPCKRRENLLWKNP